ncbi:MAG: hypothetical protein FJ110_05390 [Deltaproteobacteria bacterium]|nr:hypothetical protein [Deltaproteobacteria bacterium]
MQRNSIFNTEKDLSDSIFGQGHIDLQEFKNILLSDERNGSFLFSILVELIQRIEHSLGSIKNIAQLSRGKFSDKTFGDHFHYIIDEEIGKVDLALSCISNYIKVNHMIEKTNTVHTLIEEILSHHKLQIEGKKIRVFRKFEENLPETTALDEHLRYILDSTLRYAMGWMPLSGRIGIITRPFMLQRESRESNVLPMEKGKYIEISILFDGCRKTVDSLETILKYSSSGKQSGIVDFELKLIQEMVNKNRGIMEFGIDTKKERTTISLKFPVERRKIVYYESIRAGHSA